MPPSIAKKNRDHGGNLDTAVAVFGGDRQEWLDLSTGINPVPYPINGLTGQDWSALPDIGAQNRVLDAARHFWNVPDTADILAAPGASALIARAPYVIRPKTVRITQPTYNEHFASFTAAGWEVRETGEAQARVLVQPNNPDGRVFSENDVAGDLVLIDESFCDVSPASSLIAKVAHPGVIVLKSFGKFWGLAGLRLGFAIGSPDLIDRLREMLGPWPVSGPALRIGTQALTDLQWANMTRQRLEADRARLDKIMLGAGAECAGGTNLFGLYSVDNASAWQKNLAEHYVWTRIFPYSQTLIRLGMPAPDRWPQLEAAL